MSASLPFTCAQQKQLVECREKFNSVLDGRMKAETLQRLLKCTHQAIVTLEFKSIQEARSAIGKLAAAKTIAGLISERQLHHFLEGSYCIGVYTAERDIYRVGRMLTKAEPGWGKILQGFYKLKAADIHMRVLWCCSILCDDEHNYFWGTVSAFSRDDDKETYDVKRITAKVVVEHLQRVVLPVKERVLANKVPVADPLAILCRYLSSS